TRLEQCRSKLHGEISPEHGARFEQCAPVGIQGGQALANGVSTPVGDRQLPIPRIEPLAKDEQSAHFVHEKGVAVRRCLNAESKRSRNLSTGPRREQPSHVIYAETRETEWAPLTTNG